MGLENEVREVDVSIIRCDWYHEDAETDVRWLCDETTTDFDPVALAEHGGPVLTRAEGWLHLRVGPASGWFFCSGAHLLEWLKLPDTSPLLLAASAE